MQNELTLRIEGMSCGHCVMHVNKALAAVAGVRVKDVQVGSAVVEVDDAATAPAAIEAAIAKAGFTLLK